jgi:hypothetical protein
MTILDDVCNFPKGTDDKFRYVFFYIKKELNCGRC